MSRRAWIYIWGILLTGAVVSMLSLLPYSTPSPTVWTVFALLAALATGAQLFKAEAPNHMLFYASPVFFFAGVVLLPPWLVPLLIAIPHFVEWIKERWTHSSHLRAWYLQPFNIAMYSIAALGAHWVYTVLQARLVHGLPLVPMIVVALAVLTYLVLNYILLGLALVLARGISWRASGVLDPETLLGDLILLCLGAVVAALWQVSPSLIVLALAPLVLMYRALLIPQLKQQAQTDAKTGLANARHFTALGTEEVERARRFNRPLAVIMADLDHFKRINDTYGHLAGDTVLQGLGTIIRTTIRQYDLAGRFGGEEFALVLPETGPAAALALAERLRWAVEAARFEVPSSPTPVHATLSLGVACFPADATTFPELLQAADVSVYQAKLGGRNRVVGAAGVPRVITREAAATVDSPEVGAAVAGAPATHAAGDQARRTGETGVSVRAGSRPAGKHPAACDATPGHEFARVGDIQLRSAEDAGQDGAASAPARGPHSLLRLFVGGVIVAALGMTALCIAQGVRPEPTTLGVLTGLAALLELLPVDVYGRNTVSVSVAVAFAAALTSGTPGVAVVGAAIALVHYLRRRPALYKAAFNWAAHLLAGAAPALITRAAGLPVDLAHLPLLAVPTIVGALAYYALDTGLIAAAISLSSGARLLPTWRLQFQWLAGHYLGLCVMGLFLAIAATALGPAGIVVFALPVLMMRLAQQQYVAQTQDSVRELERMNGELARANEEIIATSRAERARLERAALTDSLTELGNHRAFQEALHRESGRARRQGETVTLARLDIDEFKQLNDQHGHGQGDRVLAELAAVLRGNRAADQAFRLGGDEFALLLPHTSRSEAVMVMERLRQDARRRLFGATVSVGVAALEPGSHDVDTLQEQAEAALYEAKRRGRDAVVTFAEVQDCVSILSPAKVQAVRRLLAEGHVRVAFQPIWDLQRGGIVAFEALARPAPDYGFAGPQEAFDIAERIGHAHDLDVVCRQAILARAAELPPDTLLFLNVSPQTLDHGLLAGTTLAEAVTAAGLTPERVVLELTERSLARLQVVVREAARLRSLGFKLALDDTGAGNAGLEMLSQVPVDVVKIDRGVVVKALTDRAARGVLAGIIAIARETDTYVIAEGIEDQAMLDVVRRVGVRAGSVQDGVHGVQGYLLGRPSEAIPAPTAVETYRTFLRAA